MTMTNTPVCPACGLPVDTNTEAHVTNADGTVYHGDCYRADVDTPATN